MKVLQALERPILLGDGANGTVLLARGFAKRPYDLANLFAPDLVREVHKEYLDAGADFIETNTFEANRHRLADFQVDIREINFHGARLAREAAGSERLVLGSIGPAGKPMEPIGSLSEQDIFDAVREQAEALAEGGVDGYFLETYIDLNELRVAIRAIRSFTDLPILAAKAYIEDGEMLAEGLPMRCAQEMMEMDVAALGANCVVGPQRMLDLVRMIAESSKKPVIAFPTPGMPQLVKGQIAYDTAPDYFAKAAMRLVEEGARVIGGCCGTTPAHIRALRQLIDAGPVKVKARRVITAKVKAPEPLPTVEPTELKQKLDRKKFLTAVEVDVPRGLNLDKMLAAVRQLKIAGVDVINISDGARARLRMNPMAVCQQIQQAIGIETTMHFSCRDRNLLAVQADLLGCHAMGVRNILAVTGDPANIGDYPSATSVFDVDAIGMTRILGRLNEGIDLAGYSVGVQCGFTIAVAFNPIALDNELERDRLRRKAEAGAHVVYTQPVFSIYDVDTAVEECHKLGLPVLVGVLPLRSARHAEFMHNEVPGIRILDTLRQRLQSAESDDEALKVGIEEAQKLSAYIRRYAEGLYVMPPANAPLVTMDLLEAVR